MDTIHCIQCNSVNFSPVFTKDGYDLVSCDNCKLVFVKNMPSEEALRKLYNNNDKYHARYLDIDYDFSGQFKKCHEDLDLLEQYCKRGNILDIGCSAGFFLKVAKDRGWRTQGIELNARTASVGRKRFGLEIFAGTIQQANLDTGSFDVVTLWDVIEHVSDPRAFLKEISVLLKPQGIIVLRTPNIDGLFPKVSGLVKNILDYWPHPEPPGHLYQFSVQTITTLLASENHEILSIIHERIPLSYSFGNLRYIKTSPKQLLYALVYAPFALIGPWVNYGDSLVVVAKKNS